MYKVRTNLHLSMSRRHKSKGSIGTVALRSEKNSCTHRVGPRPGLDILEKRKFLHLVGFEFPTVQPVAYRRANPTPFSERQIIYIYYFL